MTALEKNNLSEQVILAEAVLNTAKAFGLNQNELSQIIGKDRTTIKRGIAPDSKSGELSLMLVRCYRALSVLVGGKEDEIKHWFSTPNRHVGGIPKEVVKSIQGLATVTQYLDAIRGKV